MFTGLIRDVGTVLEKRTESGSASLKITTNLIPKLNLGDSIAVNGACLTVAALDPVWFKADVMPETIKSTTLEYLQPGDRINLEPALCLTDRLGGHLVSGHVDGIGRVASIRPENNAVVIYISIPEELEKFVALKGSVAVNGVSLTIQEVSGAKFMVSLIPHTMQSTNFQDLRLHDRVNIEVDIMARYVANLLEQKTNSGLTVEFLKEHGF